MADPTARFIVSVITRADIAERLNDFLVDEIRADDDRLTDELCQNFAEQLQVIDTDYTTDEARDEAEANLCCNTLLAMGIAAQL